jgi:hypothetical protein
MGNVQGLHNTLLKNEGEMYRALHNTLLKKKRGNAGSVRAGFLYGFSYRTRSIAVQYCLLSYKKTKRNFAC